MEETTGKRKWKTIKSYQANSSAGRGCAQLLEKKKGEKSWSCFTPYFKELQKTPLKMGSIQLGEFFFSLSLYLWWLFKPCLNHWNWDLFDFLRSASESMDAAYVLLAHFCEYSAWSFSSATIAVPFCNTEHSISFYAVNKSYNNFFLFYNVFLPFLGQHSWVQSLLFSWHTFAG